MVDLISGVMIFNQLIKSSKLQATGHCIVCNMRILTYPFTVRIRYQNINSISLCRCIIVNKSSQKRCFQSIYGVVKFYCLWCLFQHTKLLFENFTPPTDFGNWMLALRRTSQQQVTASNIDISLFSPPNKINWKSPNVSGTKRRNRVVLVANGIPWPRQLQ